MKTKHIVVLLGILTLLAFATTAAATAMTVHVTVKNASNVNVTGALVAAQSGTLKATGCTTAAGKCDVKNVTTGKTWRFVAKDANGKTGYKDVVVTSATTNVTVNIP